MLDIFMISIGGFLGAISRYFISDLFNKKLGNTMYYGTLAVNVTGSFLIGLFFAHAHAHNYENFIIVGFLGAFTTFSTFSWETYFALTQGQFTKAIYNVLSNLILGLAAVFLAITIIN